MNPIHDDGAPPIRAKSRRTRIKEHRAKRNRRRFYVIIGGEERARDSATRKNSPKKSLLSSS